MFKRSYFNSQEIPSDLFKLESAYGKINQGTSKTDFFWVPTEHCHFYRTFDSNGQAQTECTAVMGHKHDIIVTKDKKGDVIDMKCGPAKWENDKHTHEITYKYSSVIKNRVWIPEFQKVIANEKAD